MMDKREIREKLGFLDALGWQDGKETWGNLVCQVSPGLLAKKA